MKRLIYIVDDERMVLDIAVMILRTINSDWEITGFTSAADALAAVKARPPDLVLSDQCMPEMQGSELLEEVRSLAPHAVRIIMSGYFDPPSLSRVASAHQYLCKPFEVGRLRDLVERTFAAQERLQDPGLRQTVLALRSLPSIPHVYHALLRELENSRGSTEVLAQIVAEDAGISAKVLQLANSPLFAQGCVASNPLEAVMRLGTEMVKAVVLSQKLFQRYSELCNHGIDLPRIWQHSWEVARLGRKLALEKKLPLPQAEEVFLAGLLHELGKLVLIDNFPERFESATRRAVSDRIPLVTALATDFDASTIQIAAYLLQLWGMPKGAIAAVANLDNPREDTTRPFSSTAALYIADHIANRKQPPDSFALPEWDRGYVQQVASAEELNAWEGVGPR